jgi:hypothetical protein
MDHIEESTFYPLLIYHTERQRTLMNNMLHEFHQHSNFDPSRYLRTVPIQIDGRSCLVDRQGLLFDDNDTNTLIGCRQTDGTIKWF